MDIRILAFSLLITVLFYLGVIAVRYMKGKWQWMPLYPGSIIFPKRIKIAIRPSVLCGYRVLNHQSLTNLENYVEEQLMHKKVTWVDFARFCISNSKGRLSEDNFKYFLFLKQASIILQEDRKNGLRSEISSGINGLTKLNDYFSRNYVRKALKRSERNVILAEALYRTMFSSALELPYAHESYTFVRDLGVIEERKALIDELSKDAYFITLARDLSISNSSVYHKEVLGNQHAILFHVYLLLLVKWQ